MRRILLAALLLSLATGAMAQSATDDSDLFPEDEQVLRFGTADRNVTLSPYLQYDFGPVAASDGLSDGYDDRLRRARLYVFANFDALSGTFAINLDEDAYESFPIQYAFLSLDLSDTYTVKVGQQDQPFSLQDMSGSRFLPFAEAGQSASLIPGDNLGVALYRYGDRSSLAGGIYGGDVNTGATDEGLALTGRATWAPIYEEERITRGGDATKNGVGTKRVEQLLHLGLGLDARWNVRQPFSFAGGAGSSLIDGSLASTQSFTAADTYALNAEIARSWGSFSVQGEWTGLYLDGRNTDGSPASGLAHGGYAYATYFLTGERRSYSATSGTFGRVVPKNAIDEGGFGAVEVGARIDYLDLTDLGPDAGAQVGASFVVNDYLTKRLRATADYSYTRVVDGPADGTDVHALTFRLQFAY